MSTNCGKVTCVNSGTLVILAITLAVFGQSINLDYEDRLQSKFPNEALRVNIVTVRNCDSVCSAYLSLLSQVPVSGASVRCQCPELDYPVAFSFRTCVNKQCLHTTRKSTWLCYCCLR